MVRDAALAAGASFDQLVRPRADRRVGLPILIGAGLAAAGAALALVHVAGVDPRLWIAPGQSGLVPGVLEAFSAPNPQTETP
jgi:hypothetical protein